MAATIDFSDLVRLAELVTIRNQWETEVTNIIARPALIGHMGEYIAARIFGIQLEESASHKGSDGYFLEGPLAGRSVNVKWYARRDNILDFAPSHPDFYLVLAGPRAAETASTVLGRPWLIRTVHLFNTQQLLPQLGDMRLGIATSVRAALWDAAEMYPVSQNPDLILSDLQRELLNLFGVTA